MGIMEKNMETTISKGYIVVIWGVYGDNGKENGNYYILGLYSGYMGSIWG